MVTRHPRILTVVALVAVGAGCAARAGSIGDIRANPARYQDRRVVVHGRVATSYGAPLFPYQFYKIEDGTGDIVVLSRDPDEWTPTRGARVRVKGRVENAGVFGGRAVGLHIASQDLDVLRP
ncbi:MAG: hypothetical protein GEU99_05535 [Luteitalea sp.]|nr:hypothetical protein [Luteitalea sp.]